MIFKHILAQLESRNLATIRVQSKYDINASNILKTILLTKYVPTTPDAEYHTHNKLIEKVVFSYSLTPKMLIMPSTDF